MLQGAVIQWCWPDGRNLLLQDAVTVTMFRLMRTEAQSWMNDEMEALRQNNG